MNKPITINEKQLPIKEYNGQRVVTFKDVDEAHGRPEGTARKRFHGNREHFVENIDYFKVPYNGNNERPPGGRSLFDMVNDIEGYRGMDYSGYIFIAQNSETKHWKIGRTKTQKTAEKRLNLARTTELKEYQYFDCVDTLKANKLIQERLKEYRVKNSWYECDLSHILEVINDAIKEVTDTFEPRKYHRGGYHGDVTLLTESGYLMLAKSFTDDLAWKVQRELVNNYFRAKAPEPEQITLEALATSAYHYCPKTFNGEPVISVSDFVYFSGVSYSKSCCYTKSLCRQGKEYYRISGLDLQRYKRENTSAGIKSNCALVLNQDGVRKLLKHFGLSGNNMPLLEQKKALPQGQERQQDTKPVVKQQDKPPITIDTASDTNKPISGDDCVTALNVLRHVKHNHEKDLEMARAEGKDTEFLQKQLDQCKSVIQSVGMLLVMGY